MTTGRIPNEYASASEACQNPKKTSLRCMATRGSTTCTPYFCLSGSQSISKKSHSIMDLPNRTAGNQKKDVVASTKLIIEITITKTGLRMAMPIIPFRKSSQK